MSNRYAINKGVNQPIEFRGLKSQYIWWLAMGLALLVLLFSLLYICGVHVITCLVVVFALGTALFVWVYKMSNRYGQYGLMKKTARKYVPDVIKCEGGFK